MLLPECIEEKIYYTPPIESTWNANEITQQTEEQTHKSLRKLCNNLLPNWELVKQAVSKLSKNFLAEIASS